MTPPENFLKVLDNTYLVVYNRIKQRETTTDPREATMILAHAYPNSNQVKLDEDARFALVLRKADGTFETIDTGDTSSLNDRDTAIRMAMFSVKDERDRCDVYWHGSYYGTAYYVDMTPNSWFSQMEVVFSRPLY